MWLIEWWKTFSMLRVLIKLEWKTIYNAKGEIIHSPTLDKLQWPILVLSEKEWDEFRDVFYKGFEWNFDRIEEYSYENKKDWTTYSGISLVMEDWGQEYQLRVSWNSISRSLVNSLAGWDTKLGKLNISVYNNIKWDKTYPCIGIKNDDVRTEWKFSIDEQKELIKVAWEVKGKKIMDYTDYETALKKLLPWINARKKVLEFEKEPDDIITEF